MDNLLSAQPSPRVGLVTVFSNFAHTVTHLFVVLYATAVIHLPRVFDLPYGELLGLASVGLILFGVGALPAGWLGDRWSQVGMIVVFFLGVGAGGLITGFATSTTELFIGLSVIGLFASIYHPVGIAWLIANASKQGMTLGINGVFGSIGSALAPVFVGAMIDWVSWRAAFWIPSLVSIAGGLALAYCWWRRWVVDTKADRVPPPAPEPGAVRRVFLVLTLTMACSGFVYAGLTNTMPKLFELRLGSDLAGSYTEIGLYVGAVIGFSSISSIVGGWLADRYAARTIYIVFWLLGALPALLMVSSVGGSLLFFALLAMFFITGFTAAENMLVARYTPFEWRSLAYGAKFVLALGIGGLTVKLAGWLFDSFGGFEWLYALFGAAGLLAAGAALLLPRATSQPIVAATQTAQT